MYSELVEAGLLNMNVLVKENYTSRENEEGEYEKEDLGLYRCFNRHIQKQNDGFTAH